MATPFTNIYDKFLNLIDSYSLANFTDEELDFSLSNYLSRSASIDFKQCRKDLNDVDDELQQFNEDLTGEEQWIIAMGMVLSWLSPQIMKEELLRASVTDRDYGESSHANQLDKLNRLERSTRRSLTQYIISYTQNDSDGMY